MNPSWRQTLAKGMKLDVMKEERLGQERVEGWVIATVRDIDKGTIHFDYDGIPAPCR